jgi:lysophospholipase L1-like esterase
MRSRSKESAMSARRRCLVTLVGAVLVIVGPGASSAAGSPRAGVGDRHPLYIALGDSWAAGFGASAPSEGYVPQLHAALRRKLDCRRGSRHGCTHLELVNLAQGGATTPSLNATQLPTAVALLESRNHDRNRRNDVKVVTLHVGGNDVVFPILAGCPAAVDAACVNAFAAAMAQYRQDLDGTFAALRAAAGRRTRLVIGTYDAMFVPPCPFSAPINVFILEGGPPVGAGLHDVMRRVARRHHAEVAEVVGRFGPGDRVGDCLHPSDSGYDKVTRAFLEVLRRGQRRGAGRTPDAYGRSVRRRERFVVVPSDPWPRQRSRA